MTDQEYIKEYAEKKKIAITENARQYYQDSDHLDELKDDEVNRLWEIANSFRLSLKKPREMNAIQTNIISTVKKALKKNKEVSDNQKKMYWQKIRRELV